MLGKGLSAQACGKKGIASSKEESEGTGCKREKRPREIWGCLHHQEEPSSKKEKKNFLWRVIRERGYTFNRRAERKRETTRGIMRKEELPDFA